LFLLLYWNSEFWFSIEPKHKWTNGNKPKLTNGRICAEYNFFYWSLFVSYQSETFTDCRQPCDLQSVNISYRYLTNWDQHEYFYLEQIFSFHRSPRGPHFASFQSANNTKYSMSSCGTKNCNHSLRGFIELFHLDVSVSREILKELQKKVLIKVVQKYMFLKYVQCQTRIVT